FCILLTGVFVFVFYLFRPAPLHWNEANLEIARGRDAAHIVELERGHADLMEQRKQGAEALVRAWRSGAEAEPALDGLKQIENENAQLRRTFQERLVQLAPDAEPNDKDYVFITFIMEHLPVGIIGLLLAMIFCAGMSSTSAELSALVLL